MLTKMKYTYGKIIKFAILAVAIPCLYGCGSGGGGGSASLEGVLFGADAPGGGLPDVLLSSFSYSDYGDGDGPGDGPGGGSGEGEGGGVGVTGGGEEIIPAELGALHNPEPATMLLLGTGMASMAFIRRRKKYSK